MNTIEMILNRWFTVYGSDALTLKEVIEGSRYDPQLFILFQELCNGRVPTPMRTAQYIRQHVDQEHDGLKLVSDGKENGSTRYSVVSMRTEEPTVINTDKVEIVEVRDELDVPDFDFSDVFMPSRHGKLKRIMAWGVVASIVVCTVLVFFAGIF